MVACLHEEYAKKLRDLFEYKKRISAADVALLRTGRHFRFGESKIIVGRNQTENNYLAANRARSDYTELPDVVGPISAAGRKTKAAVEIAAKLTAFYSDAETKEAKVKYGKVILDKTITVHLPQRADVDKLRVGYEANAAKKPLLNK